MKEINAFPDFNDIVSELRAANVRQLYQQISEIAARAVHRSAALLCDKLMEQERRATSGIGGGVALPQLRLKIDRSYTLVGKLAQPVDFNAVDGQPVCIVCLLLSPEGNVSAHLQNLSRLTRFFRDEALRQQLLDAKTGDALEAQLLASREKLRAA